MENSQDPSELFVEIFAFAVSKVTPILDSKGILGRVEKLVYENVEGQLSKACSQMSTFRTEYENDLAKCWNVAYEALDSMFGLSHAIGRKFSTDEQARKLPSAVRRALVELLTRSTSVGHEILALLRAGFATGAHARWRTLHELNVVLGVLRAGNRWTAARYINHRYIGMRKKADPLFVSDPQFDAFELEAKRQTAKFIRRYGRHFERTYGWASEITQRKLGVKSPKFSDLEKIARVDQNLDRWYQRAHLNVLANSLGNIFLYDDNGNVHFGASSAGIRTMILVSIGTLEEINKSTLSIWDKYGAGSECARAFQFINAEISLIAQTDTIFAFNPNAKIS